MGAKAATLWFTDAADPRGILAIAGRPDEAASRALAETVLGCPVVGRPESLARAADPLPGHVYVAAYGGLTVVAHDALRVTKPSELDAKWWNLVPAARTFLLIADPDRAIGGFGLRFGDTVRRSFAAHPVDILEDEGLPELFEGDFWAGKHPLTYAEGVEPDPRALPFHPMEFAEQANRELLGFRFTHPLAPTDLDPARIQVIDFVPAAPERSGQHPQAPYVGAPQAPYAAAPQAEPVGAPTPEPDGAPQQRDGDSPDDERGRVRAFFGF